MQSVPKAFLLPVLLSPLLAAQGPPPPPSGPPPFAEDLPPTLHAAADETVAAQLGEVATALARSPGGFALTAPRAADETGEVALEEGARGTPPTTHGGRRLPRFHTLQNGEGPTLLIVTPLPPGHAVSDPQAETRGAEDALAQGVLAGATLLQRFGAHWQGRVHLLGWPADLRDPIVPAALEEIDALVLLAPDDRLVTGTVGLAEGRATVARRHLEIEVTRPGGAHAVADHPILELAKVFAAVAEVAAAHPEVTLLPGAVTTPRSRPVILPESARVSFWLVGPSERFPAVEKALSKAARARLDGTGLVLAETLHPIVPAAENASELLAKARRALGHTLGIPFLHVQGTEASRRPDPFPHVVASLKPKAALHLRVGVHDGTGGAEDFSNADTPANRLDHESFRPLEAPIASTVARALNGLVFTLAARD